MQYDQGGYIIPYFSNIIDAYSSKVGGFVEAKSGFPFGNYWLKNVGFVAGDLTVRRGGRLRVRRPLRPPPRPPRTTARRRARAWRSRCR